MYGYEEYNELYPEQVLQKISQEKIFEWILDRAFSFEERYRSPLRDDDNPGCRFEQREDGTILFIDFGDTPTHRNCFMMIMSMYGINLHSAIKLICNKFSLSTSTTDYSIITTPSIYSSSREPVQKEKSKFDYNILYPSKRDKLYWSRFLISMDDLKEDNVYCTNRIVITKEGKRKSFNVYGICYAIDFIHSVLLYQPHSTNYRFITNCDQNDIGNIDNLPTNGDQLIISKSYKDHRVLRNVDLGLNVVWFRNEGSVPDYDILSNLSNRFKFIKVLFDNDIPGIEAGIKITALMNQIRPNSCETIVMPTWKDPASFVSKEGRVDLVKTLKKIGL